MLILTGCGGAAQEKGQLVRGAGFSFRAPAGWRIGTRGTRVSASQGSELVQVSVFPLLKPYTDALFDAVTREMAARMQALAKQAGGTVSSSGTVTAAGIRSHSYRVAVGAHIDEYTFVLRGMHEYQLLCRRTSSHDDSACRLLVRSFAPA